MLSAVEGDNDLLHIQADNFEGNLLEPGDHTCITILLAGILRIGGDKADHTVAQGGIAVDPVMDVPPLFVETDDQDALEATTMDEKKTADGQDRETTAADQKCEQQ